jgi:pimeloyl-[acyl-carrier protein] methyl ester esterase
MTREFGRIHAETMGSGRDVVLVHGWGMHSGVWRDFAALLAHRFRVTLLDLPGHGRSGMISDLTLDGVGQALLQAAPERAHWLGWSLGAAIGLYLADRYPERVMSLVMLAGSARFVRGTDWPCAMEAERLSQFGTDMMRDYRNTLLRFLGLQTWGLEDPRTVLKQLRERVAECAPPELDALRATLAILNTVDLRGALPTLRQPLLLIMGRRDGLAPASAGPAMQALAASAELHVLEGAAHVPFLTHPAECASLLTNFWRRHDEATR